MKKRLEIALIIIVLLALGIPFIASILGPRTAATVSLLYAQSWDTSLSSEDLNSKAFADAKHVYDLFARDNPITSAYDVLVIRRMEVTDVTVDDHNGNNRYFLKAYTYFNIPIWDRDYNIGGVPTINFLEDILEF